MALGRVCDPEDPDVLLVWAEEDGVMRAFMQFVPWGTGSWSLDTMRRAPGTPTGIMDALIVHLVRSEFVTETSRVSLNFAPFRASLAQSERIGASPISRAWRSVLMLLSRWVQIETIYRYNQKFNPAWEPRYILYARSHTIPGTVIAYMRAEGFLPRPRAIRRMTAQPAVTSRVGVPA